MMRACHMHTNYKESNTGPQPSNGWALALTYTTAILH